MKTENPKAIWRRVGRSVRPANEAAEAMLCSIKDQAECVGEFRGVRSVQQIRLWWSLMRLLADQGIFPSQDAASAATKIAAGHTEISIAPDTGEVTMIPKHIRFGSLSSAEFNEVFEIALRVVCERWLGAPEHDVAREIAYEMMEDPALRALGKRVIA